MYYESPRKTLLTLDSISLQFFYKDLYFHSIPVQKNSVTKVFVYGVTHLFILEHSDKPKAFKWTNKK